MGVPRGREREWIWSDDRVSLVHLESDYGWLKATGTVLIEPAASNLSETSVLVLLGWYRILEHGGRVFRLSDFIDFA